MTRYWRKIRMVAAKMTSYCGKFAWSKRRRWAISETSQGLSENDGQLAKKPKDQGLQGQSETNELLVQKSQGLSENDGLPA